MGWSRDRCCVAVPLYNVGIYAILSQFAIVALVTGVLSFAAPYIVAVSIPSFGSYLLGALCLIVFALQGWGFFGVFKEKPASYRKYVHVNTAAMALTFTMALVWIIVSAAKHNAAVDACITQFIKDDGSSTNATTAASNSLINVDSSTVSGHTLCSIFTWVQTGVMGGLWLALLLVEAYFAVMTRVYGVEQRADHKRYNSIYNEQRQSFIRQSMLYDRGGSFDGSDPALPHFSHGRTASTLSKSSGLRNEVKLSDGDDDAAYTDQHPANASRDHLMQDNPTFSSGPTASGSPVKGYPSSPYGRPASAYSGGNGSGGHQYTNSRSNLAPQDSSPAYVHARNVSKLSEYTSPAAGGGTVPGGSHAYTYSNPIVRYEDVTDEFYNAYTR